MRRAGWCGVSGCWSKAPRALGAARELGPLRREGCAPGGKSRPPGRTTRSRARGLDADDSRNCRRLANKIRLFLVYSQAQGSGQLPRLPSRTCRGALPRLRAPRGLCQAHEPRTAKDRGPPALLGPRGGRTWICSVHEAGGLSDPGFREHSPTARGASAGGAVPLGWRWEPRREVWMCWLSAVVTVRADRRARGRW